MASLHEGLLSVLTALGLLLLPAAAMAVVLRWTERRIAFGLTRLVGSRAVLITGWLGVPIHELSHALMCVIFRHRIAELVLFRPDPESGTLGYVKHSWDRRHPWQVVGSFFIGIAPLLGGAAVILLLYRLLLPGTLVLPAITFPAGVSDASGWSAFGAGLADALQGTARAMFAPANLGSWRLWVFLYLTLCVGSHVSPSREDLKGALVGGLLVLCLLVLGGGVAVAFAGQGALARTALAGGLVVGLPLLLVACVNLPLALVLSAAGRARG